MTYYLKIKENTRIINPGDFFIGADGLNHSYNELEGRNTIDLDTMGIGILDAEELPSYQEAVIFSQIKEQLSLKSENGFYFNNIHFPCSGKDAAITNINLSLLSMMPTPEPGVVDWLVPNTPFFILACDGMPHEFDAKSFVDFAKAMTLHITTHKICAEILKSKASTSADLNIVGAEHWPDIAKSHIENYALFSNELLKIKNVDSAANLLNEIDEILLQNA